MKTKNRYTTITTAEAAYAKAVPITRGYTELEYEMLDRAIETLGKKQYVLIKTSNGIVIARPQKEVNTLEG